MISAGNDIVALKAIDKERTCLPAFYSKFIIPAELLLHNPDQISFENFVWLLWSVKESAYKYLKRGDSDLVFAPHKLSITEIRVPDDLETTELNTDQSVGLFYAGTVSFKGAEHHFQSVLNDDFVGSIIKGRHSCWGIRRINATDYSSQSAAVRLFVLDKLKESLTLDSLEIKKHAAGYPVLYNGNEPIDIPISFSHHDRYIAYSFQIPN
ncbi:4'-phosphopantetheinyl transferase superfamily protein [Mucilaginibacter sp. UR6-11]|uniref:4'-phosphopantetheinyl transferase family protein n=1 Tax=Mucilaginibacter sp. UR6-11 TaxID=1435644 RepID=UPI001E38324A|nr:4'-phosphopantetheinyl transferase superfamily protein [Mucilaginibacter sp. UR6-11]